MVDEPTIDVPKLRRAIIAWLGANPRESRRSLSLAASDQRNADVVRDIFRVDKRQPRFDTVAGLARAMGAELSDFVYGVERNPNAKALLRVCGTVAAGVWQEKPDWTADDCFEIEVAPTDVPGERYGLRVDGRSMDKAFTPGTILDCVKLIGSGVVPQDGDYVIVVRQKGDLFERTCKRLRERTDGNFELIAESTLPEFAEPIFIGKPDFNHPNEDETTVVAVVIWAHQQLFKRIRRRSAE